MISTSVSVWETVASMKIDDLKIFVAVASQTSLREAAHVLSMQPGTVSKVIRRIEGYYKQELFHRTGSQWGLTSAGRQLHQRAVELLAVNDTIETEMGQPQRLHLRCSGSEVLQSRFLGMITQPLLSRFGDVTVEAFMDEGCERLRRHQVDVALVSTSDEQPMVAGIQAIHLADSQFVIAAGTAHPLAEKAGQAIPITEVIAYPFVIPTRKIYGETGSQLSTDGWHEEAFARRTGARVDSVSALLALMKTQAFLAYMPDYVAEQNGFQTIRTTGCPYQCLQRIWLCFHEPVRAGWINTLAGTLSQP